MELNYHILGAGFPLIILHGLLGSAENWRTAGKQLSKDYKVYTVDLRNHGGSPHSPIMTYPKMAEDLRELLDHEKLSEAHLLGHSMGGKVAMQFATTYPERLTKVVIVDIAPKLYPPSQRSMLAALGNLDLLTFKSFAEIDAALAPAVPQIAVRQFLMKNIARIPTTGFRWRIDLAAITAGYDELTKPIIPKQRYEKPACFIRGEQSDYIDDGDLPLIKEVFPLAELVTIANAGHWLHADAPDAFLQVLSAFLSKNNQNYYGR